MPTLKRNATPSILAVVVAFAIVYVVWGSTYLAIRIAVESIPPFLMAGVRFLAAGALLYAVMRSRVEARPTFSQWRSAAIAGWCLLAGANGLVCWAEQFVSSGHAALLVATMPLWMVSLDWIFFRGPRPQRLVVVGLAIGLMGIYVLMSSKLKGDPVHLPGAIALLCACVFWSSGSLYARRADLHASSILVTAMEMLAAGPVLLLIGTISGEWSRLDLVAVPMKAWLALAYLSIFGSIVALSAYSWLLTVSTPARVATYAYVNPVIAVILGATVGHEVLEGRTLLAVGIILSAVILITTSSRGRPHKDVEGKNAAKRGPTESGALD